MHNINAQVWAALLQILALLWFSYNPERNLLPIIPPLAPHIPAPANPVGPFPPSP